MQNGDVMVLGGEYSSSGGDTNTGEMFTPPTTPGGTGSWQNITPFPQSSFGDGQLELLSDGTVLAGYLNNGTSYRYNPNNDPLLHPSLPAGTNPWTADAVMLNNDRPNEEAWVKLGDGSILSYEIFGNQPQTAEQLHDDADRVGGGNGIDADHDHERNSAALDLDDGDERYAGGSGWVCRREWHIYGHGHRRQHLYAQRHDGERRLVDVQYG